MVTTKTGPKWFLRLSLCQGSQLQGADQKDTTYVLYDMKQQMLLEHMFLWLSGRALR